MATEIVLNEILTHQAKEVLFQSADLEMFFKNNGFVKLVIKTGAGGTGNLTIKSVTDSNRRKGDVVIALGANKVYETSFFPVTLFNEGGNVEVEFSNITDATISAIRQTI